jgi:AcrR family transcriptional regulator
MFGAEPYGQGVTREKPAAGKRAKTRRRLVEAAVEVVAEKGFHGASVDDIAARAGLSIGALYSNFGGNDELLFAIFDEHVQWFERTLEVVAQLVLALGRGLALELADPEAVSDEAFGDVMASLARLSHA